jgi:hypothetical protein
MSRTKVSQQTGQMPDSSAALLTNVNGPVPIPDPAPVSDSAPPLDIDALAVPAPVSTVTEDFDVDSFIAPSAPVAIPVDSGVSEVRVRKPGKEFVYVHPKERADVYIIPEDFKRRQDAHLILPRIAAIYPDVCRHAILVPFCADDNFFLWPILQEDQTGRINEFNRSAMAQIVRSIGKWVRFQANMGNQSYSLFEAIEQREAPTWPPGGIKFLIGKAFRDRIVTAKDDPLLQRIRGRKLE